jgi:positive regulator of sigma E activity
MILLFLVNFFLIFYVVTVIVTDNQMRRRLTRPFFVVLALGLSNLLIKHYFEKTKTKTKQKTQFNSNLIWIKSEINSVLPTARLTPTTIYNGRRT